MFYNKPLLKVIVILSDFDPWCAVKFGYVMTRKEPSLINYLCSLVLFDPKPGYY